MADFKSQPVRELAITYTNYEDGYDVHQMKMAIGTREGCQRVK